MGSDEVKRWFKNAEVREDPRVAIRPMQVMQGPLEAGHYYLCRVGSVRASHLEVLKWEGDWMDKHLDSPMFINVEPDGHLGASDVLVIADMGKEI